MSKIQCTQLIIKMQKKKKWTNTRLYLITFKSDRLLLPLFQSNMKPFQHSIRQALISWLQSLYPLLLSSCKYIMNLTHLLLFIYKVLHKTTQSTCWTVSKVGCQIISSFSRFPEDVVLLCHFYCSISIKGLC